MELITRTPQKPPPTPRADNRQRSIRLNRRQETKATMPAGADRDRAGNGTLGGNPSAVRTRRVFASAQADLQMNRRLVEQRRGRAVPGMASTPFVNRSYRIFCHGNGQCAVSCLNCSENSSFIIPYFPASPAAHTRRDSNLRRLGVVIGRPLLTARRRSSSVRAMHQRSARPGDRNRRRPASVPCAVSTMPPLTMRR